MRLLDVDDGYSSATAPALGSVPTSGFRPFADDAAYVTDKGSAAADADAYYNTTLDAVRVYSEGAWTNLGKPVITGTRASPESIVAGTGIAFTGKSMLNKWFVKGSSGAVDISVNPQIAAGTVIGQRLLLQGRSDTDTLKLENGTGLSQNGDCVLKAGSMIEYEWDGTEWSEINRNDI